MQVDSIGGRTVLSFAHLAGMMDLVILPLWVGGMIASFGFSPILAGGIVTLYLVGVLLANVAMSRRFGHVSERMVATLGFAVTACLFFVMSRIDPSAGTFTPTALALLHFVAGIGAGAGITMVHGTLGQSKNPHGAFSAANLGIGIFGIVFFATVPGLMASMGVAAVFLVACAIVGIAAILALVAYPKAEEAPNAAEAQSLPHDPQLRLVIAGIVLLMLGNAITLSFVERIGDFRGFAPEQVAGMLVAGGFLALVAPIVAHLMQHRIPLIGVVILGPLFHGALSLAVSNAPVFPVFAACYVLVIPTVIFVHTFMFDLLAKLDASGRSNSATASMMMFGAAAGPFLGGATADIFGYPFVGVLAGAAAVCGGLCFLLARNQGLSNRLREASK